MTGNKIITVHSKRRKHRTHRAKRKAHKQSDDYHDGYINSADKPHPHHSDFDLCCNGATNGIWVAVSVSHAAASAAAGICTMLSFKNISAQM